ncbi:hypothetical protein JCGZ_18093 [Jatropha curcas]|uniref:DC1 domain-containing protein n=1 Tax=Jatropha curcas TaxID=180498 RepID=A0A067KDT1_JATCU|nr:hypothetical protein JCGZ_18093 [Jatropha curcas]
MQVPKISIEITKTFVVEDFVAEIFKVIESHHHQAVDNASDSKGNVDLIETTFTERHAHEFSFIEDHSISSFEKLKCNCCQQLISGKIYKCAECDEFILHKACAELNHKLIGLRKIVLLFLKKFHLIMIFLININVIFAKNSQNFVPIAYFKPISKVYFYPLLLNMKVMYTLLILL